MRFKALKVGELAKRTGLTVRTLHHYDEIGLLKPSLHTESGHRLYTAGDIARLQQVLSLRQLGFSLEEVRDCLDRPGFSPLEVIGLHVARLREQIELRAEVVRAARRDRRAPPDGGGGLRRRIHPHDRGDDHDRELLHARTDGIPEKARPSWSATERIQQVQAEWPVLIAEVRAEMENGTDPASPEVQALAVRWMGLINEFTGGDSGIERSVGRLWKEQGDNLVAQHGSQYDPRGLSEYIGQAIAVVKGSG